jgi:PAS domain S-box-containing protein
MSKQTKSVLTESHFRALFEQTNDGVFIISLELKYLAANQQGADMLGYDVNEIVGMSVTDVVALEQRPGLPQSGPLSETEKQQPIYERIFKRKDGSTFPVEVSTSIVYNDDGVPMHIQSIVRDITDRVKLEQMKSDFINRASHELRTPLTTAILMTELIREGGSDEEVEEFWQILINELNRQKTLIDRLLIAGRLESNMLAIDPGPLELRPLIEEAVSSLMPLAKKSDIEIQVYFPDQVPLVFADAIGLQQVIINLTNNAVKFSPPGSSVRIEIGVYSGWVSMKITDQGMGIPEKELPNMFKRFYRARNVSLAEIPGSGLGLYLVKSIIDELGGDILVTSQEGVGTTFDVRLKTA